MLRCVSMIEAFATKRNLPLIPVDATHIHLIPSPSLFFDNITSHIAKSRRRVILSALYLGTGDKETQLVRLLANKLAREPFMNVSLLLDYHRGQRTNSNLKSSANLLELVSCFKNFELSLVKTRSETSIFDKIQKLNEIQATYHAKFGVFDRDVLITGANLSDLYFKNRQDRYMMIRDSCSLSEYMVDLASTFSSRQNTWADLIRELNLHHLNQYKDPTGQSDTIVVPLVQHKPSNLNLLDELLDTIARISRDVKIHMSTGYFNPGDNVTNFHSLLIPSERSNGFFKGHGLLGYIPKLYADICRSYKESHPECRVYLYDRPGWSFHAKGVWIRYPDGQYLHIIGSSNYNLRSSQRDLELQFVIVTTNRGLITALEQEREALWSDTSELCLRDAPTRDKMFRVIMPVVKSFL